MLLARNPAAVREFSEVIFCCLQIVAWFAKKLAFGNFCQQSRPGLEQPFAYRKGFGRRIHVIKLKVFRGSTADASPACYLNQVFASLLPTQSVVCFAIENHMLQV